MDKEGVLRDYGSAPFSKFKEALAELATEKLTPIGEEMRCLMAAFEDWDCKELLL